ncbi:unnamed protein product [Candida verbasci]|uniref:Phosphoribulokinase/uridine kinase domain-containing protein n=1 Tax=Candida verbasci TaxID=1227364 RepID=A0A9W4TT32_9ASCO|nr:unnamed protein product [Candida verbasci]
MKNNEVNYNNNSNNSNKPILIALGGPSSSGKTTVGKSLHSLISNSELYHLDDFYISDSLIPIDKKTGLQNWDCAEAIDFEKFKQFLIDLKNDKPVVLKSIQPETRVKLTDNEESILKKEIEKANIKRRIIFIDGFMLFHDPELIKLFDIKLFYHCFFETLKSRRESRNGYNTSEGFWVDPPNYFEKIVWPAYTKSHSYLFNNHDVNSKLKPEIKEKYNLHDISNDSISLFELVNWSLNIILDNL